MMQAFHCNTSLHYTYMHFFLYVLSLQRPPVFRLFLAIWPSHSPGIVYPGSNWSQLTSRSSMWYKFNIGRACTLDIDSWQRRMTVFAVKIKILENASRTLFCQITKFECQQICPTSVITFNLSLCICIVFSTKLIIEKIKRQVWIPSHEDPSSIFLRWVGKYYRPLYHQCLTYFCFDSSKPKHACPEQADFSCLSVPASVLV